MQKTILVAGATGNLGGKISRALIRQGANVIAVVRNETSVNKINSLEQEGIHVVRVNMLSKPELVNCCAGVDCIVSALSGLAEVIIDTQKILVDAAIEAGVQRFIPSDYSLDFTALTPGTNRNLDLRRSFHEYLDRLPIRVTTIFNGAFMDLLTGEMPLILYKFKRVLYWGDPSVKMDLTLTDDVADYTARVAMDDNSPRFLRIAGESVNAHEVRDIMNRISGKKYRLFRAGSISRLNGFIKVAKMFSKDSTDLYPPWQGMQYMRDMMEGKAVITNHDNDRYNGLTWTSIPRYLQNSDVK